MNPQMEENDMLIRVLVLVWILVVLPNFLAHAHPAGAEDQEWPPGMRFRDCDVCPEMVVVPAGSFDMGSSQWLKLKDSRPELFEDIDQAVTEGYGYTPGPVHRVTIDRAFAVSRFEVTFDQWDACWREGGCQHHPNDNGWGRGGRPAIGVSWHDAQEYVRWLQKKTEKSYRLLSESEWEYAARGGRQSLYNTGATISPQQANYCYRGADNFIMTISESDEETYETYMKWHNPATGESILIRKGVPGTERICRGETVEIGTFPPNDFGLYDVHGNASEWVQDCYRSPDIEAYKDVPNDGTAWETAGCETRVLRGGDFGSAAYGGLFDYTPDALESASRWGRNSKEPGEHVGFRVAQTLAP